MRKDTVLFHRKELHRRVCGSPVFPCTEVSRTRILAEARSPFCLLPCFAALCTISFSTVTRTVFPCISRLPWWSKVTIFQIIKIHARIRTNDGKKNGNHVPGKKRKQTQLYLYHLPFLILKLLLCSPGFHVHSVAQVDLELGTVLLCQLSTAGGGEGTSMRYRAHLSFAS